MHPYSKAPLRAFWSRAVAENFNAAALLASAEPLIKAHESVGTAGSCFASNLVPYLESNALTYLRTEQRHSALAGVPSENLGYDKFSAAYGNIYTVRQLLQLLRRCLGKFQPAEDRWATERGVVDPFRPGLKYYALSDREFDLLTAQHLRAVRRMFETVDVFIFTLGLTEAWVSRVDGAVFPACPGTVAGEFSPAKHTFVNFSVAEITQDLEAFAEEFRAINPDVRLILTVSPVPLVATATNNHVLCSSTYSKSVLRVAAEEISQKFKFVTYFPAYEIITGPQAPDAFFESDRRNVTPDGVKVVMAAFLDHCQLPSAGKKTELSPVSTSADEKPVFGTGAGKQQQIIKEPASATSELSRKIAEAECEEAMADRRT